MKKLFQCRSEGIFFGASSNRPKYTQTRQGLDETVILADVNLRGAQDKTIAEFAVQNHMVVLTQDVDFAKLYHTIYRRELTVILVNTKEGTAQSVIQALTKAQLKINLKSIQNKLLIITERRLRIVS